MQMRKCTVHHAILSSSCMQVFPALPIITKYRCVELSCTRCTRLEHTDPLAHCVYAGADHGHLVFHICWSFGWIDGHELVLCCGGNTFGKQ